MDGTFEQGKIRDSFSPGQCARGAVSAFLINGLVYSGTQWKYLRSLPRDKIIKGLHHLFSNANVMQGGVALARPYAWIIWKNVVSETLDAEALKHLLRISDDAAAELLKKLDLDPALKEELFESGRFLDLWALDMPNHLRSTFFADFFDHPAFRAGILGNRGLVKAWEKLASLTGTREWTRRSIPLLEKMSGKTDNFMDKVRQYYLTHTKPTSTVAPPFTHQGIEFDDLGHPDFFNSIACPGQQYCLKTENLLGHPTGGLPTDLKPDFNLANQNLLTNGIEINVLHSSGSPILIKIDGKWEGPFTWHHHQDGKTLLPVKQDIHNSMSHTGGDSVIKKGIKDFFTSPF